MNSFNQSEDTFAVFSQNKLCNKFTNEIHSLVKNKVQFFSQMCRVMSECWVNDFSQIYL